IHPEQWVIMKVALLYATAFQRDLTMECCGETEDNAAFHLGSNSIRVDYCSAIDGAYNTMNFKHPVTGHRDFRHLSDEAIERGVRGNASPVAARQWLSPTRLLGCEFEDSFKARVPLQQRSAEY